MEPVEAQVRALEPWFHNLHLPDGTQTRPDHFLGDFPAYKWAELATALPADLTGWQVLDVGCNAGFYSFELARRGAFVTAVDMNANYLKQARWAAAQYGLRERIAFHQLQVYDLARWNGRFDLVLFLGVFYHLRYPLLGLDVVSRLTGRLLAFQTLTMPGEEVIDPGPDRDIDDRAAMREPGWPKLAFIETQLAGDRTNWWAPNHAAVLALLRSAGLRVVGRPGTETYLCAPDPDQPSPAVTWNTDEFAAACGLSRRE